MELPTHAPDVYEEHDFLGTPAPTDLVYFVLNVGNADTQLLILPEELAPDGGGATTRHMVVVDVGRTAPVTKDEHGEPIGKLPQLIEDLADYVTASKPAVCVCTSRPIVIHSYVRPRDTLFGHRLKDEADSSCGLLSGR